MLMNNGLSAIDYYTTALAPCRKVTDLFQWLFFFIKSLCECQIYGCLINAEEEILNAISNF